MKKKKQTRKIKKWLAAALGLTLLGTGLWVGMNGEKLQAKPKKVSTRALFDWETPPENDRYFFGEGPLGTGGPNSIWQNALGTEKYDIIPKEYSFTLLPSDTTEYFVPNESKHLVMGETGDKVLFTPPVGEWASVIFTNMGYFQGESISLKLSFQVEKDLPSGQQPNVNGNTFAINIDKEDKAGFLMVGSATLSGKGKVKYEILKSDNQTPIKILSYFTAKSIVNTVEYILPEGLIKNLYSTKRDSDYPIDIKYSQGTEYFWFTGTDAWNTSEPLIRRTFTFTFEDKEILLTYGGSPLLIPGSSAGFAISYTGETYAKIEMPDPQGIEQSFDRIDEVTEKEVNYQFVQQIPYEGRFDEFGINNQDQTLKWTITSPIANQTVKADDWEVVDETGADRTGWFTFTDVDETTAEVIPNATVVGNNATGDGVAPSLDDFYNHYYTFKRKLTIDYTKPIDEKLLEDRDGGKYLDKTGTVTLAVNGVAREEQTFKTSINFAAPVEYRLIDSTTQQPINQTIVPSDYINNKGLVTWLAPLPNEEPSNVIANPAGYYTAENIPEISGYQFKSVKLNNQASDMQVKYTKLLDSTSGDYTQNNVVTLEYQPLYTVDVQVGALDTDENFGTIPFAPPSGTSEPYVTVQETTAPTTPENAISPTGTEPAAEFTFPTTYDFEVGTGKSYKVTQMENVNNDYTKPNQATSPVFLINDQNQLVVDGQVVSNSTYQGEDFILSWDATNKKLTIQIINQPNGEYQLVSVAPLDYGKVSLPQKNPGELIKRQDANWKVQFTDTRLDAYRTPLKLSVRLDQNFTNTNDPTKTISGILLYRPEETTAITPDAFLIEGEEIPIKEKINPDSGTNDIDWPEQAGFLLQIDAEKQTKIFAGDYQAELTFILSEDPL